MLYFKGNQMIELEQYKQELNSYTDRLEELAKSFHIEETESKIAELEAIMEKPNFSHISLLLFPCFLISNISFSYSLMLLSGVAGNSLSCKQ